MDFQINYLSFYKKSLKKLIGKVNKTEIQRGR